MTIGFAALILSMERYEYIQDQAVVLYFTSTGCNVCKALLPKVKQLIQDEFPEITFQLINADDNRQIAASFEVFTIPVILVYFEGKEFYRKARNISIVELEREISRPYYLLFE